MKKLIFSLITLFAVLLSVTAQKDAREVAVFYDSDDAYSIAAAAIVNIKYENVDYYDVADQDSATTYAEVAAISDSLHRVFACVDTVATGSFTVNYLTEDLTDSIAQMLYTVETSGITPDTDLIFTYESSSQSRPEIAWNKSQLFSGYTEPLIVQYLGYDDFSAYRGVSTSDGADTILYTSTTTHTDDAYNSYTLYFRKGGLLGESKTIEDVRTDSIIETTAAFSAAISSGYTFTIKKSAESYENFYDIYAEYAVESQLYDLTSNTTLENWQKLLDDEGNLTYGNTVTPFQDLSYLSDLLEQGENIFDYLKTAN